MTKIIDISVPVEEGMVVWPNSLKPSFKFVSSHKKGDLWTETEVSMNLHTGTHIDAPLHRIRAGNPIDKVLLGALVGPAFVAFLPKIKTIASKDLDNLNLPKNTTRLLLKTANSEMPRVKFRKNFVGLTPDAAHWIAKRNIQLVGTDYLSVAQFDKQPEVHEILLKKEVVLLEGLNLSGVRPGAYQLICLPLKLIGTEAAPVRAVLIHTPVLLNFVS